MVASARLSRAAQPFAGEGVYADVEIIPALLFAAAVLTGLAGEFRLPQCIDRWAKANHLHLVSSEPIYGLPNWERHFRVRVIDIDRENRLRTYRLCVNLYAAAFGGGVSGVEWGDDTEPFDYGRYG